MRTTYFDPAVLELMEQWKHSSYDDNRSRLERLANQLPQALERELTDRQMQVLTMYYFEGKKMERIAEELQVNVSTVSRTLHRAMQRLFRSLRHFL